MEDSRICRLLKDHEAVEAAIRRGVREALRRHKALGNPVAVEQDGRTVLIAPEDLVIPEEDGAQGRSSPPPATSTP